MRVRQLNTPPAAQYVFLILVLASITMLAFWPGLTGRFIFDDASAILGNPAIHLTTLSLDGLFQAAFSFEPGNGSRPLAMLSFALNHLADGLNPWGYKFVNLVIHTINALLIFALSLQLLTLGGVEARWRRWGAFALALAWSIHPLQVSTVLYVVQRMEALSLLFVLLALLSYLHGRIKQIQGQRAWPWLVTCLPLWALGWFSKESAALFPVYTLALELTVLGFRAHNPFTDKLWRRAYLAGSVTALAVFAFYYAPLHYTSELIDGRNFSTPERLLSQLRALTLYLGQILFPMPISMTFYYDDFAVSKGLFSPPSTALSAIILSALLVSAGWARRRYPLYALGMFIFFAAHAITSNIIPLELAFEHRNYFALFGILLAVGDILRRIPVHNGPAIKIAGASAIIIGLFSLNLIRSATWGDPLLLAMDLADKNPHSARAHDNLAYMYYLISDADPSSPAFAFAEEAMQKCIALPNATTLNVTNLMRLLLIRGAPIPDELWQKLYTMLEKAPIGAGVVGNIFAMLADREVFKDVEPQKIMHAIHLLLLRKPNLPAYRYAQIGDFALYQLHDETQALGYFIEAIKRSEPDSDLPAQILNDLQQSNYSALAESLKDSMKP